MKIAVPTSKYFYFIILLLVNLRVNGQEKTAYLLDSLWQNPISFFNINDSNWRSLCQNLDDSNIDNLNSISHSIFYGIDAKILNQTDASEGFLGYLNKKANAKKRKVFSKQIRSGFRDLEKYPNHKIVMLEGDSWMEYPFFINDITDHLMKNEDLAIYSMASAGDWVSNMVSDHKYQLDYLKLKPDIFILSGGGNDILGNNGLAGFIDADPINRDDPFLKDFRDYVILRSADKPVPMCSANFCPIEYHHYKNEMPELSAQVDPKIVNQIVDGRRYINIAYYRWLVSLKLEYKILLESIKKLDEKRFSELKIITQGYDYPVPNFKEKIGKSMFTRNGKWIKEPLMMSGITDNETQRNIIMAMIFDFNEMVIELGKEFDNVYHMDIRGFTDYMEKYDAKKKGAYWYDEIHPKSTIYEKISLSYNALIFDKFKYPHKVVSVEQHHKLGNNY